MNDKLKLIREKCIAANPEIVETPKSNLVVVALLGIIESNIRDTGQAHLAEMKLGELLEILGRPIRLADVLLAIKTQWEKRDPDAMYHDIIKTVSIWRLSTDDLEKQSEETINFLAELLK